MRSVLPVSARRSSQATRAAFACLLNEALARTGRGSREHANEIANLLGDLKGLAVKLGQFLEFEEEILPDDVRAALSRCHSDIPPMSTRELRSVFLEDLMRRPTRLYDSFEIEPFASASVGQVHGATLGSENLAVKVQYPGLGDAIRADLSLLRGGMSLVGWARPHRGLIDELASRFLQELDYEHERASLETIGPWLIARDIDVPRPVPGRSTRRILTMTRLDGRPIREWADTADPAEIDRIASTSFSAWVHMVVDRRLFHADPSPGNLLVENGRLQVVDFGCSRRVSPRVAALFGRLLHEPEIAGTGETMAVYRQMRLLEPSRERTSEEVYDSVVAPLERWLAAPARDGGWDFAANSDWPSYGRRNLSRLIQSGQTIGHDRELVFLFRAFYALYRIYAAIGAHIHYRRE